jgi:hypothetical protein
MTAPLKRSRAPIRLALGALLWSLAGAGAWGQVHVSPVGEPESAPPTPERILDEAAWERVADLPANSPLRTAARSVGRLTLRVEADGTSVQLHCTGVLVTVDLLLTAHHCISRRGDFRVVSAWLEVGTGGRSAVRYAVDPEPQEASAALDFALLHVRGQPGLRFGVARATARPVYQGAAVFVVHYPLGGEQMVSQRGCRLHRVTANDFVHTCDTAGGSSGAPVFALDSGRLVGLHRAGSRQANYGRPIAALIGHGGTLAALAGDLTGAVAQETRLDRAGLALMEEAERLVTQQWREAIAVLSRVGASSPQAPPAAGARRQHRPEPLLRWDASGEAPGHKEPVRR